MLRRTPISLLVVMALCGMVCGAALAAERTQNFDKDPNWDGHNNRTAQPPRQVRQDFGYSETAHAGGKPGEVGGFITAVAEPTYYAAKLGKSADGKPHSFETPLEASGTFASPDGAYHMLLGFFNSRTVNEWRTPNSIAIRLNGRGNYFYAYVEYCTAKWRAGGDFPTPFPSIRNPQTERLELKGFESGGKVHRWSLRYDPAANGGRGAVTATIDDATAVCELDEGHKADGATFDRFGLMTVSKSADDGGEVWFDDITINGAKDDFSRDPGWEGVNNHRTYQTTLIRPWFDFGYSPTRFAGGKKSGELGGLVFRGDCRYPEKMACYGDRLEQLSSRKPLRASGKVGLRRGVSDSGVLIGFYNSRESMQSNPAQDNGLPKSFLGISTDAPSRDGFYFGPTFRMSGDVRASYGNTPPPRLLPNGEPHDWTLEYVPDGGDQPGRVTVTLDEQKITLAIDKDSKIPETTFDRFGIISAWVDGNSQLIYFDDLKYTFRQE